MIGTVIRAFRRPVVAFATLLVLAPASAVAQQLGQGGDDGISTWRVVLVLLLCLGLAVFAAFALRSRMGGGGFPALFAGARKGRRLQLIETLRLSHQIDLCIVICDGRELLVAASAQGVQVLPPPSGPQA